MKIFLCLATMFLLFSMVFGEFQIGLSFQFEIPVSNQLEEMHRQITGPELDAEIISGRAADLFARYFFSDKIGLNASVFVCGLASSSVDSGQLIHGGTAVTLDATIATVAFGGSFGVSFRPVSNEKFELISDIGLGIPSLDFAGTPLGMSPEKMSGLMLIIAIQPVIKVTEHWNIAGKATWNSLFVSKVEFDEVRGSNITEASKYNQSNIYIGLSTFWDF